MNDIRRVLLAISVFCLSFFVFAAYDPNGIPDSSEIRKSLRETWFTAPLDAVRQNESATFENSIGTVFQVRVEEIPEELAIIVAPETTVAIDIYKDGNKESRVENKEYLANSPGSWILFRSTENGKALRIRYYFSVNSDVFLEFSTNKKKTVVDFVICGMNAAKNVPVGMPFEKLYTTSFADIRKLTKKTLPWYLTDTEKGMYKGNLAMISGIKERLDRIEYAEDAGYDEHGEAITITSGEKRKLKDGEDKDKLQLSSAGFVKWIVDGELASISGGGSYLKPLCVNTTNHSMTSHIGVIESSYEIMFALDWTRNLATALLSIQRGVDYKYQDSGVDVDINPFSSSYNLKGEVSQIAYVKDCGYKMSMLKSLLYVLAVTESDNYYLAAIREIAPTYDDTMPEFGVFNNCAAIFPYFDDNGKFYCTVFFNGKEISLEDFIETYKDCFVNLTRLRSSDKFYYSQESGDLDDDK
ncbi:MAG: hypothetical protein K6F69_02705 [Treponema sp.]|nr:hypothetical protein [Treponema sp.]